MAADATSTRESGARVALVIGNAEYKFGPRLANPPADAEALAGAFTRLGFSSVTRSVDLDKTAQDQALKKFTLEAKSSDVAVIYYAGHGMEMDGENYLLPVDSELTDVSSLGFEATRLSDVMRAVEGARKFRLVILDACRDNPFRGRMHGLESTRSMTSRGLAAVEPPGNTLVAYAARHGTTAKDGAKGQNSPYASALLRRLETPNMDIRLVLGHVRDDVMAATGNQQQPFFYGTLGGSEITLNEVTAVRDPETLDGDAKKLLRAMQEERDWAEARQTTTAKVYEDFIAEWPGGRFVDAAREKIVDLIELDEWRAIGGAKTPAEYRAFLQKWPQGKHASAAAEALLNCEQDEDFTTLQLLLTKRPPAPEYNPAQWRAFVERYDKPAYAKNVERVKKALIEAERRDGLDLDLVNTKDAYRLYLKNWPQGARRTEVERLLEGGGDDRLWIDASRKKDPSLVQRYITEWPEGRHIKEARDLLPQLQLRDKLKEVGMIAGGLTILLGGLALAGSFLYFVAPDILRAIPTSIEDVRTIISDFIKPSPPPLREAPFNFPGTQGKLIVRDKATVPDTIDDRWRDWQKNYSTDAAGSLKKSLDAIRADPSSLPSGGENKIVLPSAGTPQFPLNTTEQDRPSLFGIRAREGGVDLGKAPGAASSPPALAAPANGHTE